jgi:hypothetical protein
MAKPKLLTVRVPAETILEFQAACLLKGSNMSAYLHQFVIRTIREEKDRDPILFQAKVEEVENNVTRQNLEDEKSLSTAVSIDPQSPSLFVHSSGSDKPANTKSRAIQKDIEDVQKEAKRRIRELKEKEKKKL